MPNITPEEHLAEVLARYSEVPDARLAEIMTCAIRHMHEFVVEVGLTREEWFAGMEGLAAIGQMCDEKRQEFILLSDTLGVSMLVEMINHWRPRGPPSPLSSARSTLTGRRGARWATRLWSTQWTPTSR